MEVFKNLLREFYVELGLVLILTGTFVLGLFSYLNQQLIFYIFIFCSLLLFTKYLFSKFLDYFLALRNKANFLEDNRTANYLTFDFLKFILILLGLITIIVLGLNKILQNETIATLLGGLIGSLVTLKSGYLDPRPLTKEEVERLNETTRGMN